MTTQYVSGNGGYIELSPNQGTTWYRLDVAQWDLNEDTRTTEATTSAFSATNYPPVVPDNSWKLAFPYDNNQNYAPMGLEAMNGNLWIRFNMGDIAQEASGILIQLNGTTVEHLHTINDNQGNIVRIESDGKGGYIT